MTEGALAFKEQRIGGARPSPGTVSPLRIGYPPADRADATTGVFSRRQVGSVAQRRRTGDGRRPNALPRMLEPQPWRGDHLRRLAERRDDGIVRAVDAKGRRLRTGRTKLAQRSRPGHANTATCRMPLHDHEIGPSPIRRWTTAAFGCSPRRDGTAAGAST